MDLGDLANEDLLQLMDDPCQEVMLHELNMPPNGPPPVPWRNEVEDVVQEEDDWEVIFLRGGGWVPPEQPFRTPAPPQFHGGWELREQPPQPPTSA